MSPWHRLYITNRVHHHLYRLKSLNIFLISFCHLIHRLLSSFCRSNPTPSWFISFILERGWDYRVNPHLSPPPHPSQKIRACHKRFYQTWLSDKPIRADDFETGSPLSFYSQIEDGKKRSLFKRALLRLLLPNMLLISKHFCLTFEEQHTMYKYTVSTHPPDSR